MGADLYIGSLFEANRAKWAKRFEKAVARRDAPPKGSRRAKAAQAEVERCYEAMYASGYFRDSYNNWNLLWKFQLSWWTDIIPMLDSEGRLSCKKAEKLLAMLSAREETFKQSLSGLNKEEQEYFQADYAQLQQFLRQAIELGEPILCSL